MWTGPIQGIPTPGRRAFERGGVWAYVPTPSPLAQVIRAELLNALAYTNGDVSAAAACLEITARQLRYAMQSHHVPSDGRGPDKVSRGRRKITTSRRRPVKAP